MENSPESVLFFHQHGYWIIPNVLPSAEAKKREGEVVSLCQQLRSASGPKGVDFVSGCINHFPWFSDYLAADSVLSFVQRLLGPMPRVSFTSALVNNSGVMRGNWHCDWPHSQFDTACVRSPYGDVVMHLSAFFTLTDFTLANGATIVLPGSHRRDVNPTGHIGIEPREPLEGEIQLVAPAGAVVIIDTRLWHSIAANETSFPRAALLGRYAPWWLDLDVLRGDSDERSRLVHEIGGRCNQVPLVTRKVYDSFSQRAQDLFRHWVAEY